MLNLDAFIAKKNPKLKDFFCISKMYDFQQFIFVKNVFAFV